MHLLDARQTRDRTPYAALIPALQSAVLRLARGEITAPERLSLPLPDGARYLVMPAVDGRLAICKLITVHPANPGRGRAAINGCVLVTDARRGEPLALLDGPTVTARRTAALSMLGIQTLQPRPVRRVAIVGAGAQAFEHAIALHEVFGAQVDLVGRDAAQVRSLCQRLVQQGIAACVATDVHDALDRGFDAVITATNSRAPVLPPSVPSEVLVVAIGAFTPEMIEVPAGVVLSRQVVVDTLEGARHEAGDLIQAGVDWSRVHALAACLGADRPQHNVLFKTVGHAAWDLAAAAVALDSPINLNRADSN